jgi:uncharacterized protein (DUF2249 family)
VSEQATETMTLDVRDMVPKERHPRIFEIIDNLEQGQTLRLINDHDPKPLYYQLMVERPNQLGWEYLEDGPEVWQVRMTKQG